LGRRSLGKSLKKKGLKGEEVAGVRCLEKPQEIIESLWVGNRANRRESRTHKNTRTSKRKKREKKPRSLEACGERDAGANPEKGGHKKLGW